MSERERVHRSAGVVEEYRPLSAIEVAGGERRRALGREHAGRLSMREDPPAFRSRASHPGRTFHMVALRTVWLKVLHSERAGTRAYGHRIFAARRLHRVGLSAICVFGEGTTENTSDSFSGIIWPAWRKVKGEFTVDAAGRARLSAVVCTILFLSSAG